MPALSFSGITTLGPFWKLIPEGLKDQTIRRPRKNPIRVGDRLTLYWKQRTPVHLKEVHLIAYAVCIETFPLKYSQFAYDNTIARRDGLAHSREFKAWFGDPALHGEEIFDIIRWCLLPKGEEIEE